MLLQVGLVHAWTATILDGTVHHHGDQLLRFLQHKSANTTIESHDEASEVAQNESTKEQKQPVRANEMKL